MTKRPPIKFSDMVKNDERISIEKDFGGKRGKWFVMLAKDSALSAKRCRFLSKWLSDAADYIDVKNGVKALKA